MYWVQLLAIACGLSMDAFAVALGASASGKARGMRAAFRLAFHFGLFQFLMPVIGWFLAWRLAELVSTVDHWIAFGLLMFVGGRMVRTGLSKEEELLPTDPSRGFSLVALSIATSIDALAIGLTLGMLEINILWPSIVIGIMTCVLSLIGVTMGRFLGERLGKRMEIVGGLILCAIGLHLLISHLIGN